MKRFFSLLALSLLLFNPVFAADSAIGNWMTIDDKTGKPRSIVKIEQVGNQLKGTIIQLINPSKPNPICDKCRGAKHDKPIQGIEMLWGLRKVKNGWAGGTILDPKNGKQYKAKMSLAEGGKKLVVRGYIGFSLFGRSQTWVRQ